MRRKQISKFEIRMLLAFVLLAMFPACTQNRTDAPPSGPSSTQPTKAPSPLTGFERDLQFIRNGNFTYVWVFSRLDGKPLDKDDSAFLRTNAPQVVDWVTTDEDRKVIAGTNFNLEEGPLPILRKRFVAENYTGK